MPEKPCNLWNSQFRRQYAGTFLSSLIDGACTPNPAHLDPAQAATPRMVSMCSAWDTESFSEEIGVGETVMPHQAAASSVGGFSS